MRGGCVYIFNASNILRIHHGINKLIQSKDDKGYKTSEEFLNVSTGFKHVGLSITKKKHLVFPDGLALLSMMISVNPQITIIHAYH